MKPRMDHVRREPLPWQPDPDPWRTECGRNAANLATVSHAEWQIRWRDWNRDLTEWRKVNPTILRPPGSSVPNMCSICWDRAQYYPPFRQDPAKAVAAAIERADTAETNRLGVELLALSRLFGENPSRYAELYQAEWTAAVDRAQMRRAGAQRLGSCPQR